MTMNIDMKHIGAEDIYNAVKLENPQQPTATTAISHFSLCHRHKSAVHTFLLQRLPTEPPKGIVDIKGIVLVDTTRRCNFITTAAPWRLIRSQVDFRMAKYNSAYECIFEHTVV